MAPGFKSGGRKKGSRNKKTILYVDLAAKLTSLHYDVSVELVKELQKPDGIFNKDKAKILSDLLQYQYARMQAGTAPAPTAPAPAPVTEPTEDIGTLLSVLTGGKNDPERS